MQEWRVQRLTGGCGGWTILSQPPVLPVMFTAALDRLVRGPRKTETLEQSSAGTVLTLPLSLLALGTRLSQVRSRDQKWAHGSWLSSKGLWCPEMALTQPRSTSQPAESSAPPLFCPGCTGASLGSHHPLFLCLKAACNETCVFNTLLWWDPAWKHMLVCLCDYLFP